MEKKWEVCFFEGSEDEEPIFDKGNFATEADALEYAQEKQQKTGWGYETNPYWQVIQ